MPEPKIEELAGLWRRSLIAWPDGQRDTQACDTQTCDRQTWANWLQGARFYVDLRQPPGRPDFRALASLDQLGPAQIEWLADQEGFAGRLDCADGLFEWHREVDFQISAPYPDQGRLRLQDGMMVEEGKDGRYIEHWHREPVEATPACALRFEDRRDGCVGFIVRSGNLFMYARGRPAGVPASAPLREAVRGAASLAAAQELLDCEIAQGTIGAAGWVIHRSTLPFREGHRLDPRPVTGRAASLTLSDLRRDGEAFAREVEVTHVEGTLATMWQASKASNLAMAGETP